MAVAFETSDRIEHSSLTWGWGFIGSDAIDPSVLAEHDDPFFTGYHSAETEVVQDSDDDLFFLEGEYQ